jgi:hypothetical protein
MFIVAAKSAMNVNRPAVLVLLSTCTRNPPDAATPVETQAPGIVIVKAASDEDANAGVGANVTDAVADPVAPEKAVAGESDATQSTPAVLETTADVLSRRVLQSEAPKRNVPFANVRVSDTRGYASGRRSGNRAMVVGDTSRETARDGTTNVAVRVMTEACTAVSHKVTATATTNSEAVHKSLPRVGDGADRDGRRRRMVGECR